MKGAVSGWIAIALATHVIVSVLVPHAVSAAEEAIVCVSYVERGQRSFVGLDREGNERFFLSMPGTVPTLLGLSEAGNVLYTEEIESRIVEMDDAGELRWHLPESELLRRIDLDGFDHGIVSTRGDVIVEHSFIGARRTHDGRLYLLVRLSVKIHTVGDMSGSGAGEVTRVAGRHSFLFAWDAEGNELWRRAADERAYAFDVFPEGSAVVAYDKHVEGLDRNGNVIHEIPFPEGVRCRYVGAAETGNPLVCLTIKAGAMGFDETSVKEGKTSMCRVGEMDWTGEFLWSMAHGCAHSVHVLPDGNTLVGGGCGEILTEYTPDGEIVREHDGISGVVFYRPAGPSR